MFKNVKKSFLCFSLHKQYFLRIFVYIPLSYYCVFLVFLFHGFFSKSRFLVLLFSLFVFLLLRLYFAVYFLFVLLSQRECVTDTFALRLWCGCRTLTIVTSSIFDILLTKIFTLTTAGPSIQCSVNIQCSFIHMRLCVCVFFCIVICKHVCNVFAWFSRNKQSQFTESGYGHTPTMSHLRMDLVFVKHFEICLYFFLNFITQM